MTSAAATVRWLSAADADGMAQIHAQSFDDPWSADACATLLAMPGAFGVLADASAGDGEAALGFILCRVAVDEAEVLTLAVRPRCRQRGIGRLLLEEAMDVARSLGARQLFLEVGENNTAAGNLYLSMGLQINGRRRGYYRLQAGGVVDALTMVCAL
jgi:[ribosomal protein S18]-alanine N-acetyltransferase